MPETPIVYSDSSNYDASVVLPAVRDRLESKDGSTKFLLSYSDGAQVEALLMPRTSVGGRGRVSVCLSSQAGCSRSCLFCETGTLGLHRNLTAEEIVGQFELLRREAIALGHPSPGNVLFMGMGEPTDNYRAVHGAVQELINHKGYAVPLRKITVSTSGSPGALDRFRELRPHPGLAVSLVSAQPEVRHRLVPHGLSPLELRRDLANLQTELRRRLIIEVILIPDVTATETEAAALIEWLTAPPRLKTLVNLIPWNPAPSRAEALAGAFHFSAFPSAPTDDQARWFSQFLLRAGIPTTIRASTASDVLGACGQLGAGQPMA